MNGFVVVEVLGLWIANWKGAVVEDNDIFGFLV